MPNVVKMMYVHTRYYVLNEFELGPHFNWNTVYVVCWTLANARNNKYKLTCLCTVSVSSGRNRVGGFDFISPLGLGALVCTPLHCMQNTQQWL